MRIKIPDQPKFGEIRLKKKFLWRPIKLRSEASKLREIRWLETAIIQQRATYGWREYDVVWQNVKFME